MPLFGPQLYEINQFVAVVAPKQRFADWLNSHPDSPDPPMTVEHLGEYAQAILIPPFDMLDEAREWLIGTYGPVIMAEAFNGWYTDDSMWPDPKQTLVEFDEWFNVFFLEPAWSTGAKLKKGESIIKRRGK